MYHAFVRSRLARVVVLACAILFAAPLFGQAISGAAAQQIADIVAAKSNFTDAQKKMDASLVFAAKALRGELAGASFASVAPSVQTDGAGMVIVDIKGAVAGIVNQVNALGGQVISQYQQYGAVRASLPLQNIEALAADASVTSVASEDKAVLNVGALTSQGYIAHGAKSVVTNLAINGSGVKVGVLSDSASAARVAALVASGDLGAGTTVLPGLGSSGADEGAAMMEIVQDLAPGAQLYFATGNGGQAAFANNILSLAAAGCSIIVDDLTYFAEAAFQDGTVAQGVNTFVSGGGLYFSSGANSGNLTLGTSGTWEGDFLNGGAVSGVIAAGGETGFFHNFGTGASPALFDTLIATSTFISLKWSDPQGASGNDYDLFITDSTGTAVKGFSVAAQTGTQVPYEAIQQGTNCGLLTASGYCPAVGDRIYVVLFAGAARALRVDTNRGRLSIATTGSTYGHNAGQNTVTVAATAWNSARLGTSPFTGGAANPVEPFNSDGPRKIFFNPNGTAITPGNLLFGTNGGTTLQKPDVTAADGVSAKTPGFLPFFGTSAAAPHVAAIAALVKAANPGLTNTQIRQILINTALDNMAPGADRDGGYGIVMALPAVQAAVP